MDTITNTQPQSLLNVGVKSEEEKSISRESISLEDTFISPEYAHKVNPKHYKYYCDFKDKEFEQIVRNFQAGPDDIEM